MTTKSVQRRAKAQPRAVNRPHPRPGRLGGSEPSLRSHPSWRDSLSALTGFAVGQALGHGAVACGIGVGLAIGVMSVTRSLHPPGGAAALTGVIGGGLVDPAGWWFPVAPVALDAVLLVGVGLLFHRLSGHPYPHPAHPQPPAHEAPAPALLDVSDADLDAVLARVGETFDIDREDLRLLLAELELQVQSRPGQSPS